MIESERHYIHSFNNRDDDGTMVYLSRHLRIRLTDMDKNPLPSARCRIIGNPETVFECDAEGIADIPVPAGENACIDLEWESADAASRVSGPRYYWQNRFRLSVTNLNDDACSDRLTHLGFDGSSLDEQFKAYRRYFSQSATRPTTDVTTEMAGWHDGGSYPGQVSQNTAAGAPATPVAAAADEVPSAAASQPQPQPLPEIKPSGWTVAMVHEKAASIDSDNDGRISMGELDAFMKQARSDGMHDDQALAWYRKYETAAGLAEVQGRTAGRQFTDSYLAGGYTTQLRVVNASDDDIAKINRVLFPQIHQELGEGPLSRLKNDAGLTDVDRTGVEAYYKSRGTNVVYVYDDNRNGLVDTDDFIVLNNRQSLRLDEPTADSINATAALIEFMRAYAKSKPKFMFQSGVSRENWLPVKFWKWEQNGPDAGSWKYAGSDAAGDLLDFLTNSGNYSGDCATLKQLAAHQILAHQIGKQNYNRLVSQYGLYIGFSTDHNKKGLSSNIIKSMDVDAYATTADLEPGTMGFAAIALKDAPSGGDRERREAARDAIRNSNWNGEHFMVWINKDGKKVIFAHPEGEVAIDTFEEWLKEKVVQKAEPSDYLLQKSDVIITYKEFQYYEAPVARSLSK